MVFQFTNLQLPLSKKRYLSIEYDVDKIDGAYQCWEYTLDNPQKVTICSIDLIKVTDQDGSVKELKPSERVHRVYRECNLEQQSKFEKYGKTLLKEVATPIAAAAVGLA